MLLPGCGGGLDVRIVPHNSDSLKIDGVIVVDNSGLRPLDSFVPGPLPERQQGLLTLSLAGDGRLSEQVVDLLQGISQRLAAPRMRQKTGRTCLVKCCSHGATNGHNLCSVSPLRMNPRPKVLSSLWIKTWRWTRYFSPPSGPPSRCVVRTVAFGGYVWIQQVCGGFPWISSCWRSGFWESGSDCALHRARC